MSNRILDYPEATEITSDDYILLDNADTGAKCIKASALNINMDNYTIKEASGAIASFDDGEDLPLAFMGAYITALQDLHGYDYPWVGGSGRNLFNMGSKWSGSTSGLSFTTDDDYVTMNGTKSGANYVTPSQLYFDLPAGTYYAKAFVISGTTSNAPSIYVYSNQELTSNMLNTERSFTIESQTSVGIRFAFWNDGATYSNYKIGIVISKTYDIDKFYPYSNECPISGWSAVNVTRCGMNVWDEEWELGGILNTTGQNTTNNSTIRTKNYIPVVPNTQYYINSNKWQFVSGYDADKNFVGTVSYASSGTGYYINVPSNVHYIRIPFSTAYGTTYNHDISINYPSTDTEYHAYNGNTYSLTFTDGSNPLTVYGGYVDLVSGVLTVKNASVDLGTLDWQYSSISERFYVGASDLGVKATDASTPFNAISSALIAKSYNEIEAKTVDYAIAINPNATQLFARYSSITSASDFITAMNGVQLVYELATPTTYQLTPQMIYSLIGENNIFASTGDSIVDYRKLWVKPEM